MAMQNVFNILVDLKDVKTIPQPLVTQNDSVVFILEVMENGVPFDLTDTTTVSLAHTRKDKTVVVTTGTKVGNKATFALGTNETSITGAVTAKAQFYDAEGRVSTLSFGYSVGLDPTGSGYEPSASEATLIEVVLNDGPLIIQSAEEAAAYANEQGDYALQVGVDNETRYLNAVSSVALRDSTYPLPAHGDTVRITELGRTDRYVLGAGWVTTDVYNPVVIDELSQQLADKSNQVDLANSTYPLYIETYEGSNQPIHPKVLYFEAGFGGFKYWMAYTPYPGGTDRYENPCIAVSNDMINWVTPVGLVNPLDDIPANLIGQGFHFSDTHLVHNVSTNLIECWYRWSKTGAEEKIYRRTSTNGVVWAERELMFDFGTGAIEYCLSPAIIHEEGKYKMWYVFSSYIRYRESVDGFTWSEYQNVSISYKDKTKGYIPWHLDVIKTNDGYEMALNAYPTGNIDGRVLLHSNSLDGLSFDEAILIIKATDNPFAWDNAFIYRSSILKVGDLYYIHYSAMDNLNRWHTGLSLGKLNELVGHNNILGLSSIDMEFKTKLYRVQLYNSQIMDGELKTDLNGGTKSISNLNGIYGRTTAPLIITGTGINDVRFGFSSGDGGDYVFYKNTTQKVKVLKDGSIELLDKTQGVIMQSGDGTKYKIQPNNTSGMTVTNLTTLVAKNVNMATLMSAQSQSIATDITGLKADFNSLISRLKSSGLMAP